MNESTPETVLVLGAGASADYGFPLGRGLFKELSERMLADRYSGFHDILREVCEEKDITHSASALKDSNDDTIDEFLAESGDAVCRTVKIAMSYMLLNQERVLDKAALSEQHDRWPGTNIRGPAPSPSATRARLSFPSSPSIITIARFDAYISRA